MAWTASKAWASLDVLTHTDLNSFIGTGGNLFETFTAKATAAGQIPYSTGANAIAALAAGTGLLKMNGAGAPTIATLLNADVSASAAIAFSKMETTPACRVYRTANGSANNITLTPVPFDAETFDPRSWHDNSSNTTRITPDRAGKIRLSGAILWAAHATGHRYASIYKNGASELAVFQCANAGGSDGVTAMVTTLDSCNGSTDYFELLAYQNSGGALVINGGQPRYTWFEAELIPGA